MGGIRVWMFVAAAAGLSSAQTPAGSLSQLTPVRKLVLAAETHHVQGIDLDGERLWVTSVDSSKRKGYLFEFSLTTGALLRSVEVGQGERFHPGGIATDDDSLWIPVAEYRRESSAVIQKRSKRTLEVESQFEVADHIGCVAVTASELIGGNWDSRRFYVWDRQGRQLRTVANPTENAYQDMKFVSGQVLASGLLSDRSGAIDWLEYPSLRPRRRITAGNTDHGTPYTREGMAVRGGLLYLLPEDGPSRLFVFRLDSGRIR